MKYGIGILTGGKSSRMGENKALLKHEGKSFLERAIETGNKFEELIVSVDSYEKYRNILEKYKDKLVVAEDERKEYGPVEGVYRILKNSKSDYIFIMAVDMPFMSEEFIKKMFSYIDETSDCLILTNKGKSEQLCSVYSVRLIPVIEEMFKKEEHKLGCIFKNKNIKTKYIDIKEFSGMEKAIENVNTPEDYKKIM